ncbi:hypothetical protein ACPZ19_18550 [Amycolatopsis lurida]
MPSERTGAFEDAYRRAAVPLSRAPQCVDYELTRCEEDTECYVPAIEEMRHYRQIGVEGNGAAVPTLYEWAGGAEAYAGGHARMVGRHLGRALTERQRRRWVTLLMDTADEVGLPADPEFRSAFAAYLECCPSRTPSRTWTSRCRAGAGVRSGPGNRLRARPACGRNPATPSGRIRWW